MSELTPWDPQLALPRIAALRADPRWAGNPGLIAAAATQAELRTRARDRFPGRCRWWTRAGLEQATRPSVAARHADRFRAAGTACVYDLGCGAGSDALAFAAAGLAVRAVDLDPDALAALRATAADLGLAQQLELVPADLQELAAGLQPEPGTGIFCDPARRGSGAAGEVARRMHPQSWSPPWSWVVALAERHHDVGAKVAPGIPHELIPRQAQAEWTSMGGDLLEAGVWWGSLGDRSGAHRQATVLHPAPSHAASTMDDARGIPVPSVGPVGEWIVEPDPAVIRSGLVSVLAAELGGWLLDPHIAYIAGSGELAATPFGSSFQVIDEVPFARKALRRWLTSNGIGNVVIKKRGLDLDPREFRQQLRLTGDGPELTLMMTRTASGPLALAVQRL